MRKNLQFKIYNLKVENAFTLIELLVVITIIGVLAGLSVFGLNGARQASRDAVRKADLEQIRSGLGIYNADCGAYPLTANFVLSSAVTLKGNGSTSSCLATNTYIAKTPIDLISGRRYAYTSDGITYSICAALEKDPSPAMTGLGVCGSCGSSACNYIVTNP
jgi:prepilin-type N-terminal cleavage/methylation domain-containing protein